MRGFLAIVVCAALLAGPTSARSPADGTVHLVGVRTNDVYHAVARVPWTLLECQSCLQAVPVHEWTRVVVNGFGGNGEWARLTVEYYEGAVRVRGLRALMPLPGDPMLLPAARPGETTLIIQLENINTDDVTIATFAIDGVTPPDPREIRVPANIGWTRYALEAEGTDERVLLVFEGAAESASPPPDGWILDFWTQYEGGDEMWIAGYGLGHRHSGLQVTGTVPPALDASFGGLVGPNGSYVGAGYARVDPPNFGEIVYGGTTETSGNEILLFSLSDSFRLDEVATGPLGSVAATTEVGPRARTELASAQVVARVEARAQFENASLVVASAEGGSLGTGVVKIAHGSRSASQHIANIGDPLIQLSHGDCSGEWRASVEGTTATIGSAPFDAALMWASEYTPSRAFSTLWATNNGWCS